MELSSSDAITESAGAGPVTRSSFWHCLGFPWQNALGFVDIHSIFPALSWWLPGLSPWWRKHRLGTSLLMVLKLIKRHPWTKGQLAGPCPTLQINAGSSPLSDSERPEGVFFGLGLGFFQMSCQLVISHHGANRSAEFVLILLLGSEYVCLSLRRPESHCCFL